MTGTEYEIAHFRPEYESQVLEALSDLWKYDRDTRARLFRWKYLENPRADGPLGIVALHNGQVIGFRGYFADRFVLDGHHDTIGVLHPGDTFVSPSHRNRGLSVAMGNLAMQYDASKYRFFMNMDCNRLSLPGYLAMGFQPLAKRVRLLQHGRNPLRWVVAIGSESRQARAVRFLHQGRIRLGQFGSIVVTDSPRAAEMASIIAAEGRANGALRLHQDQAFFAWRFRNPVRRYVFYFLLDQDVYRAYVAMDVSANHLSGKILDYGKRDDGALRKILGYINASGAFLALSVLSYGVDERLRNAVTDLRFSAVHTLKSLMRKGSVEELALPLLIRPVAKAYTEEAFAIKGVDARKFDNWRLKPICSDGA